LDAGPQQSRLDRPKRGCNNTVNPYCTLTMYIIQF
jgi:hypothetical protein